MKLFITATGTDSGKTVVSSIFCQALKADYWKPIQTGLTSVDSQALKEHVSYPIVIHPETYRLKSPVSPHLAAKLEEKKIQLKDFNLPRTRNSLVVEGAGGILVPLNDKGDYVIDIAQRLGLEVVLVIRLYLGCINHALLSIQELRHRNIPLKGLVFNGTDTFGAISYITTSSQLPVLLHINEEPELSKEIVKFYAALLGNIG